jgi:predicted N-acetyltransferase YhbS
MVDIQVEMPGDGPAIEQLLDLSFGPGREHRPSYRLRESIAPDAALGLTARDGSQLVGTLRFWPVLVAGRVPALLLGPLAIDPGHRRQGIARNLVKHGLGRARARGHDLVFAVGDHWMFGRFGFTSATLLGLAMPGKVDDSRFLVLTLRGGALDGVEGVLCPVQAASATIEATIKAAPSGP